MERSLLSKIKHIIIPETASITMALKKMDSIDKKLLLVTGVNNKFKSVISVGDIQRSLIKNQNFDTPISEIVRPQIRASFLGQSLTEIKKEMVRFRMEFMPVLTLENELVDVIFWEDIFEIKHSNLKGNVDIPVVIMAGGMGVRLRPITNIIPKPLIPIGEKSIAEHIIEKFVDNGSKTFYMSVNYKSDMIKDYFGKLKNQDYEINFIEESKPSGTAGSLSLLKEKISSTFFVSNCDIIVNQDYEEVYKYHKKNKNELTLIGALKNYAIPYGTLKLTNEGFLDEIIEKPEHHFLVNAGLYIIEPQILSEIPKNTFFHITHLIEKIIKRNGRIGVFPVSEASWMDVGNWVEYNQTLKKLGESPFIADE